MYFQDSILNLHQALKDEGYELDQADNYFLECLNTPNKLFNDGTPLIHAKTEKGLVDVKDVLDRLR